MIDILSNKRLLLSGMIIVALISVFWGSSRYPALDDKASMGGATRLEDPLSFEAVIQIQEGDSAARRIAYSTVNWVNTNRQGMIFGVLLAAGLLTFIGLLKTRSFKSTMANTLSGFLVGAPMGVCVNCAAPAAKGLHEAGARLETTLSMMFSSPTMNVVVLTMLFTIFPFHLAAIKLIATLLFLFVAIPLLCRHVFHKETQASAEPRPGAIPAVDLLRPNENWWQAILAIVRSYAANLWFIVSRTVPLMFVAGLLGAIVVTLVPLQQFATAEFTVAGLLALVLIGTFLPVPIAFDIVVASALLAAGLPIVYVMALLITLGTYSVYPFMLLWQTVSRRVAIGLYVAVMALGLGTALFADWYHEREISEMMDLFIEEAGAAERPVWPAGIEVDKTILNPPEAAGEQPFTRFEGGEQGLDRPNWFNVSDYWPPFYYGRGIASGDINNDGWEDILVATERGPALYRNEQGKGFALQTIPLEQLQSLNTFIVALVDINNDGWLDIYLTSYRDGNHYLLNRKGRFGASGMREAPDAPHVLTLGLSFGDIDRDGDLDASIGNWYYGWPKEIPTHDADNQLHINEGGRFQPQAMEGTTGETLSMLFSDFDRDGHTDLLVANDFAQPDLFYLGDGDGNLKELRRADGVIPTTTYTTMSFDTADIDNDLRYEMYIAQIAGRPGKDARRIATRPLESYCDDVRDAAQRERCQANIDLRRFYRFGAHSPSDFKKCKSLEDKIERRECMGMMVMKTAVLAKKPGLCAKIPEDLSRARFLCENNFKPAVQTSREEYARTVPQKKNQNVLLTPQDDGTFTDIAENAGVDIGAWSWNAKFADLDNDEWQDLYIANGILRRNKQPSNFFYHNQQGGKFVDHTREFGLQNFMSIPSYTYIDYDRDGDLDIVMNTVNGPLWLYRNNQTENNAIVFELNDLQGNRFGVGSQIIVHYGEDGGRHQLREIKAGGGYVSFDAPVAHFGLGKHGSVERVEVQWSTGENTILAGPFEAGHRYRIRRSKQP